MKYKYPIINASLLAAVLFTMLFQSVHFTGHLFSDFLNQNEIAVHHEIQDNALKITKHQPNNHHTCSICEFTLSSAMLSDIFSLKLFFSHEIIPYNFTIPEVVFSAVEKSFGLRAPPLSIS